MPDFSRRSVLEGALAGAASLALPSLARAELAPVYEQIARNHEQSVRRIQQWIHQPSIAAENVGGEEGVQLMIELLRDAGFQRADRVDTDGKPGVFALLDAGAPKTFGLYFMYDVKQVDPSEWSSPPWEGRLVDKPGLGKAIVGRGAVNQKGPEGAFLAALHAIRGGGHKVPVNLVLVAEGEEEIGSPHFPQVVRRPEVMQALAKCVGITMPSASQEPAGEVTIHLGAKGVIECELVASGEKWGRGPAKDVHSSLRASVDSPAFHLVKALDTLVSPDGVDPAIDGWFERVRPLSPAEQKVNIEGLVGGYTGPGGKTVLPHRAVAKLDLRLVPEMTVDDCLKKLRAHLDKRGFADVEINVGGAYPPNTTAADAPVIRAEVATYRKYGIDPLLWPRLGGSWPGYLFTEPPLRLGAGHFGMGHGAGAHAPDEYYLVESNNPKIQGLDGAVRSFVDYLYEIAS
ncbi:MAG: M20/M25/M40 family metallo-hydrolase [Deltaproteobacteria bacterium]|nr:MAG: M20/M25/M40 family metallo-hydrolase [Deltaproteobacteria bacterium]